MRATVCRATNRSSHGRLPAFGPPRADPLSNLTPLDLPVLLPRVFRLGLLVVSTSGLGREINPTRPVFNNGTTLTLARWDSESHLKWPLLQDHESHKEDK